MTKQVTEWPVDSWTIPHDIYINDTLNALKREVDALKRHQPAAPEAVTEAMVEAGEAVLQNGYATDTWEKTVRGIYAAMRAALHPDGLDAQIEAHERNMAEQQAWLEAAAAPAEATPTEEVLLLRELRKSVEGLNASRVAHLLAALDAAEGEGR